MRAPGISSYRQQPPEGDFDAIVVGSGMGGLTCAACLAKEGKRPLVLERHYTAGGFTHVFRRSGYEWDVGIHYIGGVSHPKARLARIFDYLTDGGVRWADMGEVYDTIIFGDEAYEFRAGRENFTRYLQERFPDDAAAIERYVELVVETAKSNQSFFAEKAVPGLVAALAGRRMRSAFLEYASRTTADVMQELTDNAKLRGVLVGQFGDYGLPPSESSFGMQAMVAAHYLEGAAFPVGGCATIAESIARVIDRAGGVILTNAEVSRIVVEGKRATGVEMADGRVIRAPLVISNAGVANTFGSLVPGYESLVEKISPSYAHLGLYLGFKKTAAELGLTKSNLWIYPEGGYDHDANLKAYAENPDADFPVVYVSFPSAKDPEWSDRYPGRATVDVITFAPYDWFTTWEESRWHKRGEDYEAFKDRLSTRLLEVLYRYRPQLREHLDHCELSTPLSTKHFANYTRGEIYGLAHTPERFEQRWLRPKTKIRGLYLTGQDVATAGVAGAAAGGLLTMSAIRGTNYVRRVLQS